MIVVPDPPEPDTAGQRVPIRLLIWRAVEAYYAGERGTSSDAVQRVAEALNGPHFSFQRALRNAVNELVISPGRDLYEEGLREEVVAEVVHRMIYARSELLKNQLLTNGRSCGGYDSRSAAARVLDADEALPDGWAMVEQPTSWGETLYIGWDAALVQEPFVAQNDFPADVLQMLYEAGAERVDGDTMCRVFVVPVGGLAPRPARQRIDAPSATVEL